MALTELRTRSMIRAFVTAFPVTNFGRHANSAFCRMKLDHATPKMLPNDLERLKVVTTTACSLFSVIANVATYPESSDMSQSLIQY